MASSFLEFALRSSCLSVMTINGTIAHLNSDMMQRNQAVSRKRDRDNRSSSTTRRDPQRCDSGNFSDSASQPMETQSVPTDKELFEQCHQLFLRGATLPHIIDSDKEGHLRYFVFREMENLRRYEILIGKVKRLKPYDTDTFEEVGPWIGNGHQDDDAHTAATLIEISNMNDANLANVKME